MGGRTDLGPAQICAAAHMIRLRTALKDILCVLQILKKVRGYSCPEISLVTCASGMSSGAMQNTSHDHTELAGHTISLTPNSGYRRSISLPGVQDWCVESWISPLPSGAALKKARKKKRRPCWTVVYPELCRKTCAANPVVVTKCRELLRGIGGNE